MKMDLWENSQFHQSSSPQLMLCLSRVGMPLSSSNHSCKQNFGIDKKDKALE